MVKRNRDLCRGGWWMCEEATILWRRVGDRYDEAKGHPAEFPAWRAYDRALAVFNSHVQHLNDTYDARAANGESDG